MKFAWNVDKNHGSKSFLGIKNYLKKWQIIGLGKFCVTFNGVEGKLKYGIRTCH
jgi:hypothetical protein